MESTEYYDITSKHDLSFSLSQIYYGKVPATGGGKKFSVYARKMFKDFSNGMKELYAQSPSIFLVLVGLPLCIVSFCLYAMCYLGGDDTTEDEQMHESRLIAGNDGEVTELVGDENKQERTTVPLADGSILRERKK